MPNRFLHIDDLGGHGPCRSVRRLQRGRRGFGFTLSGQGPCILSNVVIGSPADEIGLKAGHRLVRVNAIDVSEAQHDDVVDLIARSLSLDLEVETDQPANNALEVRRLDTLDLLSK